MVKGKTGFFFFKDGILYFVISLWYSLETSVIKNTLRNIQHILVVKEHFQHGLKEKIRSRVWFHFRHLSLRTVSTEDVAFLRGLSAPFHTVTCLCLPSTMICTPHFNLVTSLFYS